VITRIKVTWTPALDARVAGYDVQQKESANSVFIAAPSVIGRMATTAWISGVRDQVLHDVQIRSAGPAREVSDWVTVSNYLVLGKSAPPADVGSLTFVNPVVYWPRNNTDDDLAGYVVRYHTVNDWASATPAHKEGFVTETQFDTSKLVGGLVYMLVKAVDTSGNLSAAASWLQIDLRPPVPTSFTISRQPDGTRELSFVLASPPSDLDGFKIRYFLGSTSDWSAMTPLHSGVQKTSPLETNQLAAGTYTFAIQSVDQAGNESPTQLFVGPVALGDPRIAGAFEDLREEPIWPGAKTDCHVDSTTGWLVANSTATWATPATWAAWTLWNKTPKSPLVYTRHIDIGVKTKFTPLVSVLADGTQTLEERHSDDDITYSAYAAIGPQIDARYIDIRVTITGTYPKIKSERIILSGTPVIEYIEDVSTAALTGSYRIGVGDVRLPIVKSYSAIKRVDVTGQSVGGTFTWSLEDKNTAVGPRVKLYVGGSLTDVTIDATVIGV